MLTGAKSIEEIKAQAGICEDELDSILATLHSHNFLDIRQNKIVLANRFHSSVPSIAAKAKKRKVEERDPALQLLQNRLAPELSEITWRAGVDDGGVEVISARQDYEIEIFGNSRIAVLLYGILLGSGVTNTQMGPLGVRDNQTISHRDIGSTYLRASDVGSSFRLKLSELAKEFTLFPISSESKKHEKKEKSLRIYVGDPTKEDLSTGLISQWMRQRLDFFLISTPHGGGITWGPLVKPGKTPCLRCIDISRKEQGDISQYLENGAEEMESSIAAAHEIAGRISQEILYYVDGNDESLVGARTRFHSGALCNREHITYALHPRCGCAWE
ncbi:MAG: hypothetical protein F2649_03250 [Actinobacteria bacterium]|nr:hypothetical protein [Actinomycetota bacterium]